MTVAWWAIVLSVGSLFVAAISLAWQVFSSRRARRTLLEVRFGRLPMGEPEEDVIWCGIEVVNHSDFAVRVQDVQLVIGPPDEPGGEPLIVGLRNDGRANIPGTIEPHDSGFIGTGIPRLEGDMDDVLVYANAITAVGNVPSQAYEVRAVPHFPAPMRFERMFPDALDADALDES